MCILGQVPRVVEDTGVFRVVMLWLLCDTNSLCEEAWVVGEVESAGKEPALLKDVGDVAKWTSVAGIDMDQFR